MNQNLTLEDFSYQLPEELIAQQPAERRDGSRLLEYRQGQINHHHFAEIASLIPSNSLLIVNDSKVIPGRIYGHTPHGGKVEIMLLSPSQPQESEQTCRWQALGRPMKKLGPGQQLTFDGSCHGEIITRQQSKSGPFLEIEFKMSLAFFENWLDRYGQIPLPPYIRRDNPGAGNKSPDRDRYQTIFASHKGSVAAPTAGLHFTPEIFAELENRGITISPVTLHVGAGTFLPVKTEQPNEHSMHSELYMVQKDTYQKIQTAILEKRPIIAVGTTSFRCLQAFYQRSLNEPAEQLTNRWLETDLYIYPKHKQERYKPWAIQAILTNFHQPESTLFMLICALIGWQEAHAAYQTAIAKRYRFFSYGDATLLWL